MLSKLMCHSASGLDRHMAEACRSVPDLSPGSYFFLCLTRALIIFSCCFLLFRRRLLFFNFIFISSFSSSSPPSSSFLSYFFLLLLLHHYLFVAASYISSFCSFYFSLSSLASTLLFPLTSPHTPSSTKEKGS